MTEEERKERRKETYRKTEKRPERIAAHNEYNRQNYDRVALMLPNGTKERIKAAGVGSINGYIKELILADLERLEHIRTLDNTSGAAHNER